jgi:hypothetical protein
VEKAMSNTPIYTEDDMRLVAQELEAERDAHKAMCEELANSVRDACHATAIYGDDPPAMYLEALAKYEQMKGGA